MLKIAHGKDTAFIALIFFWCLVVYSSVSAKEADAPADVVLETKFGDIELNYFLTLHQVMLRIF